MICFVCLTVKPVGEPDAGNPHVRFDERGWETERCRMAQATAPILDSTIATNRRALNFRSLSGGAANMDGRATQPGTGANDPEATLTL